jgi:pimeloyl-ACP methyl ester carboxylesterase
MPNPYNAYRGPIDERGEPLSSERFVAMHGGELWGKIRPDVLEWHGIPQTPGWETHFILGPQGRRIAVESSGNQTEAEHTIICEPGVPGGRLGPKPNLTRNQHAIWRDRPGNGWSTRYVGRRVIDEVADVHHIMAYFNLFATQKLSIIGRSGGSGRALAVTALTPQIQSAAVIVPLAPMRPMGEAWYDGMNDFNASIFRELYDYDSVTDDMPEVHWVRRLFAELEAETKARLAGKGLAGASANRLAGITDESLQAHAEAMRFGSEGRLDDHRGAVDWEFDLSKVRVPTLVWAAEDDTHTPVGHAEYIARRIGTNAILHVEPNVDHFAGTKSTLFGMQWCLDMAVKGKSSRL